MKIRILAFGSRGDVQPYVALGVGLQRAGYEVAVGTTADFQEFVESYGLVCIPAAADIHEFLTRSRKSTRSQAGGQRSSRAERMALFNKLLDETYRLAAGADVVIYSPAAVMAAPHVAEKMGVRSILAMLQPYVHPTGDFPVIMLPPLSSAGWYNRLTYGLFDRLLWAFMGRPVNKWRQSALDLPRAKGRPLANLRNAQTLTLYAWSPTVLPRPAEWSDEVQVTGYWFLDQAPGWEPDPALLAFLEAGPPPVYVGFGSMSSQNPEQTAQMVLESFRRAGVRGVIASGWAGMAADDLPDDVFLIEKAPHDWLFPRMAAVVHHGGAGTTAAGLRSGVPSIVVPTRGDQPFWGRRVHELGCGPAPIPRKKITADSLAAAMQVATSDPVMRTRAAEVGAQIRAEDGVGQAVWMIQGVLGRPAGRPY
ncbi:glycosyltransferase [Chloroflexota bacterium]